MAKQKPETITTEQLNVIMLSVKTKQLEQLKQINKAIEIMPIYGKLRETNKLLTFGQYLTVLKGWFDSVRRTIIDIEREVNNIEV